MAENKRCVEVEMSLTQCPVCLGSGIIKKDSEVEK